MLKTLIKDYWWSALCSAFFLLSIFYAPIIFADAEPQITTTITLNGVAYNTYFNDGDTLKILDGDLRNTRLRIEGYNTLETYGAVHEWVYNSPVYLLSVAHDATSKARQGSWTCITEGKKDVYQRLLATCDDLALALISSGLAHAYSVDEHTANEAYVYAQWDAQYNKLGIWQFGVPEYIITSLHSADEGVKEPYNRLISTVDGQSKIWFHKDTYEICEKVCFEQTASCMVYVPFERRYGRHRPECLRTKEGRKGARNIAEILWEA